MLPSSCHALVSRQVDRRTLIALLVSLALLLLSTPAALARPERGHTPWAFLLCKFSDHPEEPATPASLAKFLTQAGTGSHGIADYWHDVSYGNIDLAGSVVRGWYTMPVTLNQGFMERSREKRFQYCLNAARNSPTHPYVPPPGYRVAVIVNTWFDGWGAPGQAMFDLGYYLPYWGLRAAAHEMGHGYGLQHSWSEQPGKPDVEYGDPWDIMSALNVFSFPGPPAYGWSGPGLSAPYLDRMGWLARSRIATFGANGGTKSTFTLAALSHPSARGYLMIRVPFDPADRFHYYTVEYRQPEGWDAGIPGRTVLVREVRANGLSYLVKTGGTPPLGPGATLTNGAVSIHVNYFTPSGQAVVTISGGISRQIKNVYGPNTCKQGYVWREADDSDYVCVSPATRAHTQQDNAQTSARRQPGGGLYGPDTCRQGFVWRDAFLNDHVCVTVSTRSQAAYDNNQAQNRLERP